MGWYLSSIHAIPVRGRRGERERKRERGAEREGEGGSGRDREGERQRERKPCTRRGYFSTLPPLKF